MMTRSSHIEGTDGRPGASAGDCAVQVGRVPGATLDRHFTRFTEGPHTRRDIRAGSTFRAALSLDRFIEGARVIDRPEDSNSCARAVLHQAPFKTSNAGQFGPGCVCACPYQGASRGCWPTDGATIFRFPPAGLHSDPNRASTGSAAPQGRSGLIRKSRRLSALPHNALRRVGDIVAGEAATACGLAKFSTGRLQLGGDAARDGAQAFKRCRVIGLSSHGLNHGAARESFAPIPHPKSDTAYVRCG